MRTTKLLVASWLRNPWKQGRLTHMLVVCDTWDYEEYPVYVTEKDNLQQVINEHNTNMQKVMECYAYHLNIQNQLNEHRSYHTEMPPKV